MDIEYNGRWSVAQSLGFDSLKNPVWNNPAHILS